MAANANYSSNYPKDDDSFGLGKVPGGVVHSKYASVVFGVADNAVLFTLPRGAVIVDAKVQTSEAFDAGADNTLLIGITGDTDAIAAAASVAAIGTVRYGATGFVGTGVLDDALTEDTDVIVTYNQTSTAATEGAAIVEVQYIVR